MRHRFCGPVRLALAVAFLAACGSSSTPAETVTPPPGEIIGRIEVAADVPLGNCQVPPGVHEVVLTTDDGRIIKSNVTVLPTQTTIGVDFDLGQRQQVMTKLTGKAVKLVRDDKGVPKPADDLSGLTVELVEILDGHVI